MAKADDLLLKDIESIVDYGDKWTAIEINGSKRPVEIRVKRWLDIAERNQMITAIVDMIFSAGKDGDVEFRPGIITFAKYYNYVSYFTNVVLDEQRDGVSPLLRMEMLVRHTDIVDKIREAIQNDAFWSDLEREVDEAISYRKAVTIRAGKLSSILTAVKEVINSIGNKIDDIDPSDLLSFIGQSFPDLQADLSKQLNSNKEEADESQE